MTNKKPRLSRIEIHKLYEQLGIANGETRRQIVNELYSKREKDGTPIKIEIDSVTTPYLDNNA